MKDTCRQIAPQLAALDEDRASQVADPQLARHLAECGPCRRSLQIQRAMHGLLRARSNSLQPHAPESLKTRVTHEIEASAAARRQWAPWRAAMAAAAIVGLLGAMTYGITSLSPKVLAAQLTLDHIKCARLVPPRAAVDASTETREWAQRHASALRLPASASTRPAALTGVRRCLYGHGLVAHLLYEVDGKTVSVFVMPRPEHPVAAAPSHHQFFGQQVEVWGNAAQSYAVIGDVPTATLTSMAEAFRAVAN